MDKEIPKRLKREFINFLKSQSIIGVAIGIVIGQAFAKLITSIIEGLLMPVMELFASGTQWENITIGAGRLHFKVGMVIAALINFFVVSLVVFFVIRLILRKEDHYKQ
jgi:large conductance mechanosensitive channel